MRQYLKENLLGVIEIIVVIISAYVIWIQLNESTRQTRLSMRGQMDEAQSAFEKEAREDDVLNTLFVSVDPEIKGDQFKETLLRAVTEDSVSINAANAADLADAINGSDAFLNLKRRAATKDLRRVYLYAFATLNQIHNGFDYKKDGILDSAEWNSWKGSIREIGANPVFLTALYVGHRYNYISRDFANLVHEQLISENPVGLKTQADSLIYFRDKNFIKSFYPEMFKTDWADSLPDF